MQKGLIFRFLSSLYVALVVIVPFSVMFRMMLYMESLCKKGAIDNTEIPVLYVAKLDSGMEAPRQQEIVSQIANLENVAAASINLPIPAWPGDSDQEAQWNELWKTYLSPLLYATCEIQLTDTSLADRIAGQIESVSGIVETAWDQDDFDRQVNALTPISGEDSFYSRLFFFFIAASLCALVASYPIRFRRDFAVRAGLGGAGSQINPELIWIRLVSWQAGWSAALYVIVYTIGYQLFPCPSGQIHLPLYFSLLWKGVLMTAGLVTAVCLIGWWLPADEINDISAPHPAPLEWERE